MTRIYLSILLSFITFPSFSQDIKLRSATSQGWAGGMCCSHGMNYVITLESSDTTSQLKLDSVWIGDTYFAIPDGGATNMTRNVASGKAIYRIYLNQSWNERDDEIIQIDKPIVKSPYNGDAMVVCHFKKSTPLHISVIQFKELPPIPYP